jgi:hypothetical protein
LEPLPTEILAPELPLVATLPVAGILAVDPLECESGIGAGTAAELLPPLVDEPEPTIGGLALDPEPVWDGMFALPVTGGLPLPTCGTVPDPVLLP